MADRFALLQLHALSLERALRKADRTKSSAIGTGLLFSQGGGLLFEKRVQGAFSESSGGSLRDLLHGLEIDIQTWTVVAKGASGHDFAPLCSEAAEFVKFFGTEVAVCHDASGLGVKTKTRKQFPSACYDFQLDVAKLFMTSF